MIFLHLAFVANVWYRLYDERYSRDYYDFNLTDDVEIRSFVVGDMIEP